MCLTILYYQWSCRYIIIYIQLTVEPHPLQSKDPYCSLTPTQQKAQWQYSSVVQGLSQRERWQQCAGGMVSGHPTQEVSPATPDLHPHSHRHSHRHQHRHLHRHLHKPHQCPLRLLLPLDVVRMNCRNMNCRCSCYFQLLKCVELKLT